MPNELLPLAQTLRADLIFFLSLPLGETHYLSEFGLCWYLTNKHEDTPWHEDTIRKWIMRTMVTNFPVRLDTFYLSERGYVTPDRQKLAQILLDDLCTTIASVSTTP
jgi:hypothetical protein